MGEPVRVSPDATDAQMEEARLLLQERLDDAHARAYASFGATDPGAGLRPPQESRP